MCRRIMDILAATPGVPADEPEGVVAVRVGRLAEKIGVHRNTVTNWIKSGKIQARPTVGRKYLVQEAELKRFCRQSGLGPRVIGDLLAPTARN
jgi:excisionase family DNA binding protein